MTAPVTVPFQLGCCPDEPRCLLCPPPPRQPESELIKAWVQRYREDLASSRDMVASFFGGPPPSPDLVRATGLPTRVRVRPDLLDRKTAQGLVEAGVTRIELDALALDDRVLSRTGRRYRGALVLEMLGALREWSIEVGIVLAVGLPRSSHEACVDDARTVAPLVDTARLHPVLVLEHTRLRTLHMEQLYQPLSLEQAIGTCAEMVDIFEAEGVAVLRVGVQPGPDGLGHAVAGPRHTAFRQLVEARRTLARLRILLAGTPSGVEVQLRCHPADETRVRGPRNEHIRILRADYRLGELRVQPDDTLARGAYRVEFAASEAR